MARPLGPQALHYSNTEFARRFRNRKTLLGTEAAGESKLEKAMNPQQTCGFTGDSHVGRAGIEHPRENVERQGLSATGGAESGAPIADLSSLPRDLLDVMNVWQSLPAALQAGILAIVKAAKVGLD
jgi:hypothetical protein